MALNVTEIFYSIQGESLHAGRPCVFIRLSGCNLRCRYCDTRYAYTAGNSMEIEEILSKAKRFNCRLVEITGGEPLLQPDTPGLAAALLDAGYEVLVETNGSINIDCVDSRCCRIVDLKCPASDESHRNDLENFNRLTYRDQLKCVISNEDDYLFARSHLDRLPKDFSRHQVLFSPVSGQLPAEQLARWILKDHLKVRLHLQLHKIIWPRIDRGV